MGLYGRSAPLLKSFAPVICAVATGCLALVGRPIAHRAELDTLVVISDHAAVRDGGRVVAMVEKGRSFGAVRRRRGLVEVHVCVGTDIHRGCLLNRDVRFLTDRDVDLGAEALRIAKALNPSMNVEAHRARLDTLVGRLVAAATGRAPREQALRIGTQLFQYEKFAYDPDMDRLDEALDHKRANCLGLSLLYLVAARKMSMPLYLVDAPGHAFVRFDDGRRRFDIETTTGKLRSSEDWPVLPAEYGFHGPPGGIYLRSLPAPRAVGVLTAYWGRRLAEMGNHAAACEKFARAVEINPGDYFAYMSWGRSLAELGKDLEASSMFARAAKIYPKYAFTYTVWGNVLAMLGKDTEACEKFAEAVRLDPCSSSAHDAWGAVLVKTRRYTEACETLARAAELAPRSSSVYCLWGKALAMLAKHEDACEKLARAVELDPACSHAYLIWGYALQRLGRHEEACSKYARAADAEPGDALTHLCWAMSLAELGRRAQALERLKRAIELDPTFRDKVEELRRWLEGDHR